MKEEELDEPMEEDDDLEKKIQDDTLRSMIEIQIDDDDNQESKIAEKKVKIKQTNSSYVR